MRLQSSSCGRSLKLPIREFKINDKFAYLIDKNKNFARPSRAFFLIPCISFKFSANLRREMTISQVF